MDFSRIPVVLFSLYCLVVAQAAAGDEVLSRYLWESRIFLVEGAGDTDAIVSRLEKAQREIDERHVLWFVLNGSSVVSNADHKLSGSLAHKIRAHYFSDEAYRAVLIGKDGGIKKKYLKPELQDMFSLIDTMPMRKREMQERERRRDSDR